jgi:hypothetical protein
VYLRWLVKELGILSRHENKANSHVFGSVKASINLEKRYVRFDSVVSTNVYVLVLLPNFVLHTSLVDLDTLYRHNTFLGSEEPRSSRRVGEPKQIRNRRSKRDRSGDNHEPLPRGKAVGLDVQDAKSEEPRDNLSGSVHQDCMRLN